MPKEKSKIDWEEIINKFSSYKDSINKFCEENNIKHHQLYHSRKKLSQKTNPASHAIALNKDELVVNEQTTNPEVNIAKDIKIEIGKTNIYISANEIALISNIIKEPSKPC